MSPPSAAVPPGYGEKPPLRRRRRRRRIAQVVTVAAGGCGVAALFFLLVSLRGSGERATLQRRVAAGFAAAGVVFGLVRAVDAARSAQRARRLEAEADAARSGMTLILALLLGSALAALSLHALAAARAELRAAESAARARRLGASAGAEARRRLQELADDRDPIADHPDEDWAKPADYALPGGVRVESRVEDENRRFNLNNLALAAAESGQHPAATVAAELLSLAGAADARRRLDALRAAMRDPHSESEPRFLPLQAWADLAAIEGFDRDFLERAPDGGTRRLRPVDALTVTPFDALQPEPVNLNTAPADVLAGLFGRERDALARAVLSLREAAPLRSLEPLALLTDPVAFARMQPWLAVRSSLFRVEARASDAGGERRIRALARRGGDGRVRILEWAER